VVQSQQPSETAPRGRTDIDGRDVTSGLPNDITGSRLTLTMGHGQMVTSGLRDDVTKRCITSGLLTDSAIIMTDLAAEC